jgi:hypothetical protein
MLDVKVEAELRKWKGQKIQTDFYTANQKSLFEVGLGIKYYAKKLSPVLTGRLRASISMQMVEKESGFNNPTSPDVESSDKIGKPKKKTQVRVGTAVPYAMKIEYGTSKSPAQSFLRTALGLVKGEAYRVVEDGARIALEKV